VCVYKKLLKGILPFSKSSISFKPKKKRYGISYLKKKTSKAYIAKLHTPTYRYRYHGRDVPTSPLLEALIHQRDQLPQDLPMQEQLLPGENNEENAGESRRVWEVEDVIVS